MQLHEIKPDYSAKKNKRIGRGGKRGTYSGRGMKGQKSRSGARRRPAWRDLLKQMPKLRGVGFRGFKKPVAVINFGDLEKKFKTGDMVTPQTLLGKGLIGKIKGRLPAVKILAKGKLTKKIRIIDCELSSSAARQLQITAEEKK